MIEDSKSKLPWKKPNRRKPSEVIEQEKVSPDILKRRQKFLELMSHLVTNSFLDDFNLLPESIQEEIIIDITKHQENGTSLDEIFSRLKLLIDHGKEMEKMVTNNTNIDLHYEPKPNPSTSPLPLQERQEFVEAPVYVLLEKIERMQEKAKDSQKKSSPKDKIN